MKPIAIAGRSSMPAAGAWDTLFAGEGVMISEQIAYRMDLGKWATTLPMGSKRLERSLASTLTTAIPKGQATVSACAGWKLSFPEAEDVGMGLRLGSRRQPTLLMSDLQAAFDLPADALIDQRSLKGLWPRRFLSRPSPSRRRSIVLTLAVAGVAVFTSLLTLADRRLLQLAPLWSIGLTRRDLALAELAKTVGLALLTVLLAVPLGLLLAYLLVTTINVQAFGWRLPLHLYPDQWIRLGFISLLIALLAAALPVLRLYRMPPARLLKVFADAR